MTDEFDPAEQRRKELAERFAREAAEREAGEQEVAPNRYVPEDQLDDMDDWLDADEPSDSAPDVRS